MSHCCKFCGETNPSKFYGRQKTRCKDCHNIRQHVKWKRDRYKVIDEMGGKCCICDYDNSYAVLQLHHIEPEKKDDNYNVWGKSYNFLKEESKKCVLFCSNCHLEYHNGHFSLFLIGKDNEQINSKAQNHSKYFSVIDAIKDDTDLDDILQMLEIGHPKLDNRECHFCEKDYKPTFGRQKFCSPECAKLASRKVKTRPDKETLVKLVEEIGYSATGRKYGVSDNAIRKWIR